MENLNQIDINRLEQVIRLLKELNKELLDIIEVSLGGLDEHDQRKQKIDFLLDSIAFWSNPKNF